MEPGVAFAALDLGGTDRFQRLRAELGVSAFGLNLMRIGPGQRGRIHRHERQEEVYLVLEGELTLVLEDGEHRLARGELARVAPDVRRQLVNRRAQPCAVLALGGDGDHEGRDGVAYREWTDAEGAAPADIPIPSDVPVE